MSIPTAEEITTNWGERCPDYDANCPCCQMWAMHDRIDELEKTLEPFANEAAAYDPPDGDDRDVAWASDFPIGALRSARAALDAVKGER